MLPVWPKCLACVARDVEQSLHDLVPVQREFRQARIVVALELEAAVLPPP